MAVVIEINTDSPVWLQIKHALHSAGLRYFFQENLFSPNKTLFLEPRAPEPEGGQLKHGMIIYRGGAQIGSTVQEVYDQETNA